MSVLSRLARVALVVVLLPAWQAALQHPIEHVDELGELIHVHSGHSDGGSEAGPLCDLLASLTACAPDAANVGVVPEAFNQRLQLEPESAPRVAEAPPFLSQGPPASV